MRPLNDGVAILLLGVVLSLFAAGSVAAQGRLAITAVTVVDVTDGALHSDRTVLVADGRLYRRVDLDRLLATARLRSAQ